MLKLIKKNKWYLLLFCYLCVLAYIFPYTHDDWYWGTDFGISAFNSAFENVNGRYLGNLLVFVLTRSKIIKMLVIAITLFLLFLLIKKNCQNKKESLLLGIILIFSINSFVFKQTISWTSGFVNYVVPMLGLLSFIYILIYKKKDLSLKTTLIMLPLGIINSLFMENLTIYNLILSITIIIYLALKKQNQKGYILYFLGSLIGTIIMFSNNTYAHLFLGNDTYGERSISFSNIISSSISKYINIIVPDLLFNNVLLIIFISFFSILILKNEKQNKKLKNILFTLFGIFISYYLASRIIGMNELFEGIFKYIDALFALLFIIILFLLIFFFTSKKKILLFYYFSIIMMILPLFAVEPFLSRCMFPPLILLIILTILLALESNFNFKKYKNIFISLMIIILSFISLIYVSIYKTDIQRYNFKNENILKMLPHREYVYNSTPVNKEYLMKFKKFYNIDLNKKIKFIDYSTGEEKVYEEESNANN